MLPVSQYEALLAEVRGLRRKAQRVQQLATPLISNCSSDKKPSLRLQDAGVNFTSSSYEMEPLFTGRQHNASSANCDGAATLSPDGDPTFSEDEYGGSPHRPPSTHMSVSSEPIPHCDRNVSTPYHDTWPVERSMWNSDPIPNRSSALPPNNPRMDVTSVMSFASSSGGALMGSPSFSRRSSQQLEAKVDMVYSLLAMLSGQEHADMGETLLALSANPDSCLAMRQSGCIPLLVQMVQTDREAETRSKASQALHNLVHAQPDEKQRKREVRVLKLLEQTRTYAEALRNHQEFELEPTSSSSEDDGRHPVQTVAHLMKLSFDELHRQAICTLGGIHTISSLVETEHVHHGSTIDEHHCILMRRYACMALTNLTFGDSGNKALLCSFRDFMRALVVQLQNPADELRQVTASVLRNLSWRADSSSKEILREVGSVTGLMKAAMMDNKENTLKSILSALWNLSAHCTENKSEICSVDGALGFLVGMLTYRTPSKSLAIIENSGGILRNISSQIAVRDDYREVLRQHNCLEILLDQLKSASLTIVSNACGTLWNLSAKCPTDQEALWQMGAPAMLRSLNHSKHKMIAMGSSAALKNLLSSRPSQALLPVVDSTALAMDLPALPTLGARKQKALLQDLSQTLAETYDNLDKDRPVKTDRQKASRKYSSEFSDFSSLTEPSTSYLSRTNLSLPHVETNDLGKKCFVKSKVKMSVESDGENINTWGDSGLQFDIDTSSIDNDKCKRREVLLKEISTYSDERDHCSVEDVSDSDNQSSLSMEQKIIHEDSSLSNAALVARKEVPHSSILLTPNLPHSAYKYANLASSNITMFEGDIDEIDMDDISIHFTSDPEQNSDIGEKQDVEKEKAAANENIPNQDSPRSGIPLRSLPRPIPSSNTTIDSLSFDTGRRKVGKSTRSGLPRRSLLTSTPIRTDNNVRGSSEAFQVQDIDRNEKPAITELSIEQLQPADLKISEESKPALPSPITMDSDKPGPECSYLNPKDERDRLLERSCEDSNPVDNRMLDPDAMIESLDRFTAELVSQASHLQNNNTWNEDSSPNEVTCPSISGSEPNVITFSSEEGEPQVPPESNDFSSLDTSTMTASTLIAIEATKMATVFKNQAEMSSDCVSPKFLRRKRSLPRALILKRALSSSLNNGSSVESLENHSLIFLDQINPPSFMGDLLDLEGSMTSVASLPNENTNFIINGASPKARLCSVSDLENINPPSLFNEITDLCNSLADVPTEAIASETEIFEDCQTHVDDVTEFSDANSATPIQSDVSSTETSPKKTSKRSLRERYKTYTLPTDDQQSTSLDTQTFSVKAPKMTPKEKRQNDPARYETRVIEEAVTDIFKQPIIAPPSSPRTKLNIRRNFMQKRLENQDRFKTHTVSESPVDLHLLVQREADLVLKSLGETKNSTDELLECETLSLVSNDDDSEQNSFNYGTYHKSWGLKKDVPIIEPPPPSPGVPEEEKVAKPKIIKPSEKKPQENVDESEGKGIRGKRKPLYSRSSKIAPRALKPIKNVTSNLVRNVTSSIKSVKQTGKSVIPKPPTYQRGVKSSLPRTIPKPKTLERQGTFTKGDATRIPQISKIPSKIPSKSKSDGAARNLKTNYGRSTSADSREPMTDRRIQSSASSQSLKSGNVKKSPAATPAPRTESSNSVSSNGTSARKQVTSKIASLWKKIEESKNKQPAKKDSRVWIQGQAAENGVVLRNKTKENDAEKRVSRLGSFIVVDDTEGADD